MDQIGPEWNDAAISTFSIPDGEMKIYLKYDEDYLYLALDLDDTTREENDEIQLYFGTLLNWGQEFNQPDDRHYGVWRVGKTFVKDPWVVAVGERPGG